MKKIIPIVLLILITAVGLWQWNSFAPKPTTATPTQDVGTYTLETFKSTLAEGDAILIDVRTPEEVKEGYINNTAVFANFNDTTQFTAEMSKLDKNKKYLVYCRSGNRSGQAVRAMKSLGFVDVHDLKGGVIAWTSSGETLVTEQ